MNKNFLWGASSSSFQSEGMWKKAGQGPSVIEIEQHGNLQSFQIGVDFYHHYKNDIKLMKEAGLKAFRFSISWSRVFPTGTGKPNAVGVNFYRNLITELAKAKIEPIVTIYHFDYPLALVKKYGGWISRKSIADYLYYCNFLFKEFGNTVKYWVTINEQDHIVKIPQRLGFKHGGFKEHMQDCYQANHYMSIASSLAIKLCHTILPKAKIGPAVSYQPYYPATEKTQDIEAAKTANLLTQKYILDLQCKATYSKKFQNYLKEKSIHLKLKPDDFKCLKEGKPDFIGINYYSSNIVKFLPSESNKGEIEGKPIPKKEYGLYAIQNDPTLPTTKWGWTIDPKGLRIALEQIYEQYHLPILITENGYGDEDKFLGGNITDSSRIKYLKDHINELIKAINENIPVMGYCIWSFTDVISGHNGSDKRYGLIYVDKNMNRIPKQSFNFYKNIIRRLNGDVTHEHQN